MAVLIDSLKDTIKDTVTLIPFLFITYLAMEWLEDKTEDQSVAVLSRISRFSHVLGAGIGRTHTAVRILGRRRESVLGWSDHGGHAYCRVPLHLR